MNTKTITAQLQLLAVQALCFLAGCRLLTIN
jgi:hypothetical protein